MLRRYLLGNGHYLSLMILLISVLLSSTSRGWVVSQTGRDAPESVRENAGVAILIHEAPGVSFTADNISEKTPSGQTPITMSESAAYCSDNQTEESITSKSSRKISGTENDSGIGDVNGDDEVNLADAILALQVLSGNDPTAIRSDYVSSGADVNGDNKVGFEEAIYILQGVCSLRRLLPLPIYPVNGATHVDPDYVSLLWFGYNGDHRRFWNDVQVSASSDFSTIIKEENDWYMNSLRISEIIQPGRTYWWRVRASKEHTGYHQWTPAISNWVTSSFSTYPVVNANGPDDLSFEERFVLRTGHAPECIIAADFDGDTKIDLATADKEGKEISIFRNTSTSPGNLSFSSRIAVSIPQLLGYSYESHLIIPGDFDGDGKPDIAAALHCSKHNTGLIYIFLNATSVPGNISFIDSGVFIGGGLYRGIWDMKIADFDGDGRVDLIHSVGDWRFQILPNSSGGRGDISFDDKIVVAIIGNVWTRGLGVGDFDNDGHADFVYSNGVDLIPELKGGVWRNTSTGAGDISFSESCKLTAIVDADSGRSPDGIAVADFDNDGNIDLAVLSGRIDTVFLFRNTTAGPDQISFPLDAESLSTNSYPSDIVAADFNGDGKIDIATADQYSNKISVFRNQSDKGRFFFPGDRISFVTGKEPHSIVAADFDGDGLPDIATADCDSDEVSVFRNSF